MTEEQATRRAEIETAAFKVLERVGYKKASMLQIAKEAKASNETLYAWYGNKQSLFQSLIVANAGAVKNSLKSAMTGGDDVLFQLGKLVLGFTATEKAIIINRAAVTDVPETGLLAEAIEAHARTETIGVIEVVLTDLSERGAYAFEDGVSAAAKVYVDLLIGELQMQQSLGAVPALTKSQIEARARRTSELFSRLFGNAKAP